MAAYREAISNMNYISFYYICFLYYTQEIKNREHITKDEISTFILLPCA